LHGGWGAQYAWEAWSTVRQALVARPCCFSIECQGRGRGVPAVHRKVNHFDLYVFAVINPCNCRTEDSKLHNDMVHVMAPISMTFH
jgi:hypothetical protein